MNSLVEEAKDDPVVFVSITNDPEAKVRDFLKTHPLKTSVAIDKGGAAFRLYRADMIPRTAIIGPTGELAAITRPEFVTLEVLRNVAAGRDPGLPKQDELAPDLNWDRSVDVLSDDTLGLATLRSSKATSSLNSSNPSKGRIVADGVDIKRLLVLAYGADESPVRGAVPSDSGRYRVSIKAADSNLSTAREMLRTLVQGAFPYTARWEPIEREAPALRRTKGPLTLIVSTADRTTGYGTDGHLEGKGVTMSWIARRLGMRVSDVAALDETGVLGKYDIILDWDPSDALSLRKALGEVGLDLISVQTKIPTLFIEPASKKL